MSNFAAALKEHLDSISYHGIWERRAYRIVSEPEIHKRVLERWERKSATALGIDWQSGIIDWFKANWKTILQVVLTIVGLIFMFAEPGDDPEKYSSAPEGAQWFPGKNVIEQFLPEIIRSYGIPTLRAAMPGVPGSDDDWVAWGMAKYKEGQSQA